MFKLLIGVVVGAVCRDALYQAYRRNYFPYQDRLDAIYTVARYGCINPGYHDTNCTCAYQEKEDRKR